VSFVLVTSEWVRGASSVNIADRRLEKRGGHGGDMLSLLLSAALSES
jgi:hypothetical protein